MNNLLSLFALCGLFAFWAPANLSSQNPCLDTSLIDQDAACITLIDPVCGCDGVTYSNSCEAVFHNGIGHWVHGECPVLNCADLNVQFSWNFNPYDGMAKFSDQSTFPGGQITALNWNFGDGNSSNEPSPVHVFPGPGTYVVCLTVNAVNANGQLCTGGMCQSVTIANCISNCAYDFNYEVEGTRLRADLNIVDPPFFFFVNWSLDNGAATGTGMGFTQLFKEPGRHTLCATYPTGDFSAETCTVCHAFEVKQACVDVNQIDSTIACPLAFIPVCGCDGVTYDNACSAINYGGVSSWTPGICGSVCNNLFIDFDGANTGGSLTTWTFLDQSVFAGGTINSWYWDFGNGQSSFDPNPTINFNNPGEYEVCLTISGQFVDGTQCGGTFCKKISVAGLSCVDPALIDLNHICTADYAPVCGCDGKTYSNECEAYYHHGVRFSTPGVCPNECVNPQWIDPNVLCFEVYDPVCGCNGVTYDNECYALNYGGVTAWRKGVCCESSGCNAFFTATKTGPNTVLITNLSDNDATSVLSFGDGSPAYNGAFDTLSHIYAGAGVYQICLEIGDSLGSCSDKYCVSLNTTSAVSEPKTFDVTVSPNPSSGLFTVAVTNAKPQRVEVFDMLGKILFVQEAEGQVVQMNLGGQASGVYFLRVFSDFGVISKKIEIK